MVEGLKLLRNGDYFGITFIFLSLMNKKEIAKCNMCPRQNYLHHTANITSALCKHLQTACTQTASQSDVLAV